MKPKKKKLKYYPLQKKKKSKSPVKTSQRSVYGNVERENRSRSRSGVSGKNSNVYKKSSKYLLKDKDFYDIIKDRKSHKSREPLFDKSRKSVSKNKMKRKKSVNRDPPTQKPKKSTKKSISVKKNGKANVNNRKNTSKNGKAKSFISHTKKSNRSISRSGFDNEYDTLVKDHSNYDTRKSKMIKMLRKPSRSKSTKKKVRTEEDELIFKPMLSKKSLQMAKRLGKSRDRLMGKSNVSNAEKYEEMYQKERDLRRSATPKINKRSKYIDQKTHENTRPRYEMLYQRKDQYRDNKEARRIQKIEEEMQKEMMVSTRGVVRNQYRPNYYMADVDIADRANMWKSKKMEKLNKLKTQREANEMKSCTFSPHINKRIPSSGIRQAEETVYNSEFLKEGLYNHYNRIERAKKGKSYQEMSRSRSKSTKKKAKPKQAKKKETKKDERFGWLKGAKVSQTSPVHYVSESNDIGESGALRNELEEQGIFINNANNHHQELEQEDLDNYITGENDQEYFTKSQNYDTEDKHQNYDTEDKHQNKQRTYNTILENLQRMKDYV